MAQHTPMTCHIRKPSRQRVVMFVFLHQHNDWFCIILEFSESYSLKNQNFHEWLQVHFFSFMLRYKNEALLAEPQRKNCQMSHRRVCLWLEHERFRQVQEIYVTESLYLYNLMKKVICTTGETHLQKMTIISLLTF